MYRLLGILLLIVLCACSSPAIDRSSPAVSPLSSLPEDSIPVTSPSPSLSLSPSFSPSPSPSPEPSYPTYVEPTYPDISLQDMQVIAQHEYEDITVTQCHYTIVWEGHRYEGTNISAKEGDFWKNEWELEYIGSGDGQYDKFRAFVPGRERIYLLHGGMVNARDVITGEDIWNLELAGAPFIGVVDSNGILYIYCEERPFITAISPDGEILWQNHRVEDYRGAWYMEIVDDEIVILTEDDYGKYHIFFDYNGIYRVEKIPSPEF